ncbi:peptidase U32 family protein [Desulfosediminicola ganghwensis]|uniref:peptidase U32 family protein n=1 Tax=Desulfosediminicola ganghwensis TaxID=2569540 RepID=UPI0010ACD6A0|nr:U32 family peptidase [Desulfosediminicola ganghwensis]
MQRHPIELLSPARDLACGVAAVNHGADAVYVGAPKFGARAAVGNSLHDIEQLIRHAHTFNARVYIALNTILTDDEIEEATRLAHSLYNIGADALIIQDMGLLECELPPISLHASTQCNNRTPEKVEFLEKCGFQQIVLARELSLAQIREIRQNSTVPLECFIHGALCVSYSGQCYISEVVTGRSANRGECAQFCRHKFTLKDGSGKILAKDKYLLSLKDLDLSNHLKSLLDAGVSSFKIEGRLKGIDYVKNVTAFYRKALDELIDADDNLQQLSSGRCRFTFTPDTSKSFNRGKTDYFLTKKRNRAGSIDTPKSLGELLGKVVLTGKGSFVIATHITVHNGDGLCYFDESGNLVGVKANRAESAGDEQKIFHRDRKNPHKGAVVYRNLDTAFIKELRQSENCRFLEVSFAVGETESGLKCQIVDEDGICSEMLHEVKPQQARKAGMMESVIERQMKKVGGTPFRVAVVKVFVREDSFYAASDINELRRAACEQHLLVRKEKYESQTFDLKPSSHKWLADTVTYLDNILNSKAKAFYARHGVKNFQLEISKARLADGSNVELMRTRYCLKAQLGRCPKSNKKYVESLEVDESINPNRHYTLNDNTGVYDLEFDCDRCEMVIRTRQARFK